MFLKILEFQVENKKNGLGKTVLKMWSQQSPRRISFFPQNPPMIVNVFMVFCFNFLVFALFLKVVFWTHKPLFCKICDLIFKTVFPKHFFLFSIVHSKMSRNKCKLRHKLGKSHFYPMKVQISNISKLFFLLIKVLVSILGFQKRLASIRLKKYTRAIRF